MWLHTEEDHGWTMGPNQGAQDYLMVVTSQTRDPVARILEEGVVIEDLKASDTIHCLNSNSEFFQSEHIQVTYSKGLLSDQPPGSIHQPSRTIHQPSGNIHQPPGSIYHSSGSTGIVNLHG